MTAKKKLLAVATAGALGAGLGVIPMAGAASYPEAPHNTPGITSHDVNYRVIPAMSPNMNGHIGASTTSSEEKTFIVQFSKHLTEAPKLTVDTGEATVGEARSTPSGWEFTVNGKGLFKLSYSLVMSGEGDVNVFIRPEDTGPDSIFVLQPKFEVAQPEEETPAPPAPTGEGDVSGTVELPEGVDPNTTPPHEPGKEVDDAPSASIEDAEKPSEEPDAQKPGGNTEDQGEEKPDTEVEEVKPHSAVVPVISWVETNKDGERGGEEVFVPGATVTLGDKVLKIASAENASYSLFFTADTHTFHMKAVAPEGYKLLSFPSTDDVVYPDAEGNIVFTLTADGKAPEIRVPLAAREVGTVSISTWYDTGNGAREASETSAQNLRVELLDADGRTVARGRTGSDGNLSLIAPVGEYRVRILAPANVSFTSAKEGVGVGVNGTSDVFNVTGNATSQVNAPLRNLQGKDDFIVAVPGEDFENSGLIYFEDEEAKVGEKPQGEEPEAPAGEVAPPAVEGTDKPSDEPKPELPDGEELEKDGTAGVPEDGEVLDKEKSTPGVITEEEEKAIEKDEKLSEQKQSQNAPTSEHTTTQASNTKADPKATVYETVTTPITDTGQGGLAKTGIVSMGLMGITSALSAGLGMAIKLRRNK